MIWIEIGRNDFVVGFLLRDITYRNHGREILLTDKNESKVKAFLYSKFPGSKELILKQEGFEDERLKLEDLFNEI